jgi:hypothetical protein
MEARAEASHDISAVDDWHDIASGLVRRSGVYIPRKGAA